MTMKYTVLLLLVAVAGAAAQAQTTSPLVDALKTNPELSLLYAAIARDPALLDSLSTFKGTIFAPNNQAFTNALQLAQAAGLSDAVDQQLAAILAYHLVPGTPLFKADLSDGLKLKTANNGEELTVKYEDGALHIVGIGSDALVVQPDIKVGKNVAVHVVDTVLLPIELPMMPLAPAPAPAEDTGTPPVSTRAIYDSVVDAAKAEGLDSLVAALEAVDLASALGPDFNGTVFAPTNQALESFLDSAGIDPANLTPEQAAAVTDVLLYHVVPDLALTSKDFTNNEVLETLNGEPLTILVRKKGVLVEDAAGNKVAVTVPNVKAGSAVVHVIDGVLMPSPLAPAPTSVPPSSAHKACAGAAALAAALLAALLA